MVGCVGTDASADFLVNTAKEYGVNVDYIRKVPGSSGMGVINAVEDGSVYACIVRVHAILKRNLVAATLT